MFKLKILIIFILGSGYLKAAAQRCNTTYLGTKTLYKNSVKKRTMPPAGFKAVFVNYIGRHGARHLTKEVSTSFAWQFLNKADSMAMLTDNGLKLRQMVLRLNKVEHGNVKSISAEGKAELQAIGERIFADNPFAFRRPILLDVALTKEIRTKQSADAFLAGFKRGLKDSIIIKEHNDDTNLRFYDLSPAYTNFEEKGAWLVQMDSLKKGIHLESLEQHIAARWLKPALLQQLKYTETDKLINDVFGFENITYSAKDEAKALGYTPGDLDIASLFTCDELNALGKIDNAYSYYAKGPGLDINGIQVKIAAPLLADFIRTTDAYFSSRPVTANLRFAHAETVSPFAAIMGIKTAGRFSSKVANIEKSWKASDVIPLSANIQWVIYTNKKGTRLIRFLLNEGEVQINGLKPVTGNCYAWPAVRKFYMDKLSKFAVSLNTDMKRYLSELK